VLLISLLVAAISAGQTAPQADTTGRVAGRVTADGTSAPVAGAHVTLMPMAPGRAAPMGMPPQATTDQDGRFTFDRLAPGTYRVDVQKVGYASINQPTPQSAVSVMVATGQTTPLEVRLKKGAVITGRIVDASGEPMAELSVVAMRRVAFGNAPSRLIPAAGGAQTNDIGEFRLSGLAAGDYYVVAMPRGTSPFGGPGAPLSSGGARATIAATFFPGTTDQASAHPIAVSAGAEVGNISFAMLSVPAFRVSGVVVDENGNPVAGARVMLMGDGRSLLMGRPGGSQSQSDGGFTIGEVVAGAYRLTATMPVRIDGNGGRAGVTSGSIGSTSGGRGFVGSMVSGGVSTTFDGSERPTEVTVTDADVSGVQVVVRRPRQ
jgi:protocatechuate 3,4-dioxygenase beta subunit